MSIQIALLRGINVGGRNMVAMADLRKLLESLGFARAKSLLQSGNLVFESGRRTGAVLERLLEIETAKRLHATVDYFVRSADEWESIVDHNPFPNEAASDPGHLVVNFLKAAPKAKDIQELRAAIQGPEVVRAVGKQVYIIYPAGIGRSKLTNAVLEQELGSRCTGRNWNTVVKLAALCQECA